MTVLFQHTTVLFEQAIAGLNIRPNGTYVDCTLGGAGHSRRLAQLLSTEGHLIGIDQDEEALEVAKDRLQSAECRVDLVKRNFRHLPDILLSLGIKQVNGVLFDLGVSSPQLDKADRGFSYNREAKLDMRMDAAGPLSAWELINHWETDELARIFWAYGEERFSRRIARAITARRAVHPIETTTELADIIKQAIPAPARRHGPHPARRTFQAIRIAVNDELAALEEGLQAAVNHTATGGRVSVITFHSLEDRIVKQRFSQWSGRCTCPPDFPICQCGNKQIVKVVHRKPIEPSAQEKETNPRARSAKLRIAEKTEEGTLS